MFILVNGSLYNSKLDKPSMFGKLYELFNFIGLNQYIKSNIEEKYYF